MVRDAWVEIPVHFTHVGLDEFVVMPNHFHGIIIIGAPVMARHAVPLQRDDATQHGDMENEQFSKPVAGSIPTIIRSFKSAVTKRINEKHLAIGSPVWQRNYYEHIIRDDKSFQQIQAYIINNPARWETDRFYSNPTGHIHPM